MSFASSALTSSSSTASSGSRAAAILPTSSGELFGPEGAKASDYRYSRSKRRFILDTAQRGLSKRMAREVASTPLGELGIMQQADLEWFETMRAEITYLLPRHGEFEQLDQLLNRFVRENKLGVGDLEMLRELLEAFVLRRPSGRVMEVRPTGAKVASFWPHHHPNGIWFHSALGRIGADEGGVFFLDPENREYFRSKHFSQQRVDRGQYELEDLGSRSRVLSPIALTDVFYEDADPSRMTSGLIREVVFDHYFFADQSGKLAFQLHTLAKLGVITGQPLLRVTCDNVRYLAFDG